MDMSDMIEKIEDSICNVVFDINRCKFSSCDKCLKNYAQIVVDNNSDKNNNDIISK